MQSPAAVTPIDRLAAILRLDMPPARSLGTSRILRMGNLCPGMPRSLSKGTEAMPIRRSPNGARHTRPQPGRHRPEWVVAINRNAWSQSIGIGGRNQSVRAEGFYMRTATAIALLACLALGGCFEGAQGPACSTPML